MAVLGNNLVEKDAPGTKLYIISKYSGSMMRSWKSVMVLGFLILAILFFIITLTAKEGCAENEPTEFTLWMDGELDEHGSANLSMESRQDQDPENISLQTNRANNLEDIANWSIHLGGLLELQRDVEFKLHFTTSPIHEIEAVVYYSYRDQEGKDHDLGELYHTGGPGFPQTTSGDVVIEGSSNLDSQITIPASSNLSINLWIRVDYSRFESPGNESAYLYWNSTEKDSFASHLGRMVFFDEGNTSFSDVDEDDEGEDHIDISVNLTDAFGVDDDDHNDLNFSTAGIMVKEIPAGGDIRNLTIEGEGYTAMLNGSWYHESDDAKEGIYNIIFFIDDLRVNTWYGNSRFYLDDDGPSSVIVVAEDGSGDFTSIQDAIDNATEGDIIRVWEGTYHENLVVNKTVSLIGNGSASTTIIAKGEDHVVKIIADWVNLTGFGVTGSKNQPDAGIYVISNFNTLFNNSCSNNSGTGIYLKRSGGNTLNNNICFNNGLDGIHLYSSAENNILNNNSCSNNSYYGIRLDNSNNNTLTNNTCSNNVNDGIKLDTSDSNIVINNTCSNNRLSCISIDNSNNNSLTGNRMVGNGIGIHGKSKIKWNSHEIDPSNTVNGKPIYYYKNDSGVTVPSGAGQIILTNSTHMVIENQDLGDMRVGILMGFSSNNRFSNSTSSNNTFSGIYLWESHDNILNNNTFSNNRYGIYLRYSNDNNTISKNTNSNNEYGIYIEDSNNNTISNNNCSNNTIKGIQLRNSHVNSINDNNCSNNNIGILIWNSESNTLTNNICSNNLDKGIRLWDSHVNSLNNNTCSGNVENGISLKSSDNNTINDNHCSNNGEHGILLDNADNNTLRNNSCSINNETGIHLHNSHANTIVSNYCFHNDIAGIHLDNSYVNTLDNNTISYNDFYGIYLEDSDNNLLTNNTYVNNNHHGIYLVHHSDGNTISYNNCSSNGWRGIYLKDSDHNTLDNNTCSDNRFEGIRVEGSYNKLDNNTCHFNGGIGIQLYDSEANILTANRLLGEGILLGGSSKINWNTHEIDTSNTVNGKPVHYYKNAAGITVPLEVGQVILANTNHMIVENQDLSNGSMGIQVGFSSNITISNNTCSKNYFGIILENSHYSNLTNNTCSNNIGYGIYLLNSNDNFIANNIILDNLYGISIGRSKENTIKNNTCSYNDEGIHVYNSDENVLENNTCTKNYDLGIALYSADSNTIKNNNCSNNPYGISIVRGYLNSLRYNIISENNFGIIILPPSSDNNVHYNDIFNNSIFGIKSEGTINATYNWWGDDSGPFHSTNNSDGKGDNITNDVEFSNWLLKNGDVDNGLVDNEPTIDMIEPDQKDTSFMARYLLTTLTGCVLIVFIGGWYRGRKLERKKQWRREMMARKKEVQEQLKREANEAGKQVLVDDHNYWRPWK